MKITLSNWFKSYSGGRFNKEGDMVYMPRLDVFSVFYMKKNDWRMLSLIILNVGINLKWKPKHVPVHSKTRKKARSKTRRGRKK